MRAHVLTVLFLTSFAIQGQTVNAEHQFTVFDATLFTQKPDLTQYGLKRIAVVYAGSLWPLRKVSDQANLPDKNLIRPVVQLANQSAAILVIDIEQWPLVGDPAAVAESVKKYETVIQWFKQPIPSLKVGLYGAPPIRDYWDSVQGGDSPRYALWQKENDDLAPIVQLADVLFPSIYTFYEDRDGWRTYAIAQIQEARRYAGGKPVYVFLWPQYHPSNKKLANTFLAGDYWRLELETVRKYADGVVIWCCPSPQAWDNEAPWWIETQEFLKEIGSGQQ
jgi:Hyaluronidase